MSSTDEPGQSPAGGSWTEATGSPPPGLLRPHLLGEDHSLTRHPPPAALAPYVDWAWAVDWDLPQPVRRPAPVLSHPCVHATLEAGDGPRHGFHLPAALVHGVVSRRFDTTLAGRGWVVGLRFRPGGYAALVHADAAQLTDRVLPAPGPAAQEALARAVAGRGEADRAGALLRWWEVELESRGLARREPDATYLVVRSLVEDIAGDRALTTVEELAERHSLTVRSVQRLVRWYVGVPPSWLIRRYRLQDALATLQADPGTDLADLSASLGWYDQAHFTRDFRAAVGHPPAAYLRRAGDDGAWRD